MCILLERASGYQLIRLHGSFLRRRNDMPDFPDRWWASNRAGGNDCRRGSLLILTIAIRQSRPTSKEKMHMLRYGNLGFILLAVFLILFGLSLLGVKLEALNIIMALCALAAGVLLLVNRA
jgi:hypothetical protein